MSLTITVVLFIFCVVPTIKCFQSISIDFVDYVQLYRFLHAIHYLVYLDNNLRVHYRFQLSPM